jgi:hypothetical protein
MYSTCLFCQSDLGRNEAVEQFQIGRRLAFDAARGRLWVVCARCGRWNLSPLDERWEAIETCERLFRGTRARVTTAQIGLARLPSGCELVRIGEPLRPEFAAWRYGSRFARRRARTQWVAGGATVAAAAGAIAFSPLLVPAMALGTISVVVVPGITTIMGVIPVVGALAARDYFENERVIGRVYHRDRMVTVRAKHAEAAELRVAGRDAATVTLDVPHDSGWAHFDGLEAMQAASTLLAGTNRFGAPPSQVRRAVQAIEEYGDASSYLEAASTLGGARGGRLVSVLNLMRHLGTMRMSETECLALEMALNEESERRAMDGELALLEAAWRDAEEIARLADAL